MNIAILSGKGGTGKTFVSCNLAVASKEATYIDCDIEEPNGYLFFKSKNIHEELVYTKIPYIIKENCSHCRKCVDFCHFNALAYIKDFPMLFSSICHSCGGCALVCPSSAIIEKDSPIGKITTGRYRDITIKSGVMNIGEESGVEIIKNLLKNLESKINIIDCPPGSACAVMESIKDADYCIIVAEPSIFGVHNFKMVYDLVKILNKPLGVVINKISDEFNPMEKLCKELDLNILERISYSKDIAGENALGNIAYEKNEDARIIFDRLYKKILEVTK